MIAKKYRLPLQSFVRQKGRLVRGRYLFCKIFPGAKQYSRYGVVVSTGVAPRATQRNRLRRGLYETARTFLIKEPFLDVVVIVQASAGTAPVQAVRSELEELARVFLKP